MAGRAGGGLMKFYGYAELTRCAWRDDGLVITWRALNTPYWHMALDAVRNLPTNKRVYIPAERAWWVAYDAFVGLGSDVFSNFEKSFAAAKDISDDPPAPQIPVEVTQAYAALHVTLDAPASVVQAAYRALSRVYHPDNGGDELTMKRLNAAYEVARRWAEQHAA